MELSKSLNFAPQVKGRYRISKKIEEVLNSLEAVATKIFDLEENNKNLKKCLKVVGAKLVKIEENKGVI